MTVAWWKSPDPMKHSRASCRTLGICLASRPANASKSCSLAHSRSAGPSSLAWDFMRAGRQAGAHEIGLRRQRIIEMKEQELHCLSRRGAREELIEQGEREVDFLARNQQAGRQCNDNSCGSPRHPAPAHISWPLPGGHLSWPRRTSNRAVALSGV